jgi:hypothetical protein
MDIYNSKLAKFLGLFVKQENFAITTSESCVRYSCSKGSVSVPWRKHEECHKRQYLKLGWFNFIRQYILESIKHGYTNNKFEVEARETSKQ